MAWVAVGGAVGVVGSIIGGNKAAKAAKKQQESAIQAQKESEQRQQQYNMWANQENIANAGRENAMNRENYGWANETNKGNELWGQDLNRQALADQTSGNRLNSTNAFGGQTTFGDDGTVKQTLGAGDQANMDSIYGKTGQIINGMGEQFGVNNDVMNALRGQLQPGVDQQAAAQRARAAAFGSGFGSGEASGLMEDQIGRNYNDMNQKAVLGGQNAWLQGQNLLNSQLGAMNQTRQGIQSGTAQPEYWNQNNYAGVDAPSVQGWQSNIANVGGPTAGNAMDAMQSGQVAGAGVQQDWNQMGSAAGDATSALLKMYGGTGNTAAPTLAQQGAADFTNGWNSTNYG